MGAISPIILIDFGVEKCESVFASSIIPVPQGTNSNAQRYYRIDISLQAK
jgi:hypothetical protein